tara:strand:- start:584 stop:910 length:327 start_codon:yes stop_codon:yes gene_type:complete
MKESKIIAFSFPVKMHAELKARLFYDEIPMTKFVRGCIEYYLNDEPCMMQFINELKEQKGIQNKLKRKANNKLVEKGKQIKQLFGLDSNEIKDIYDVLESEIKEWPEI